MRAEQSWFTQMETIPEAPPIALPQLSISSGCYPLVFLGSASKDIALKKSWLSFIQVPVFAQGVKSGSHRASLTPQKYFIPIPHPAGFDENNEQQRALLLRRHFFPKHHLFVFLLSQLCGYNGENSPGDPLAKLLFHLSVANQENLCQVLPYGKFRPAVAIFPHLLQLLCIYLWAQRLEGLLLSVRYFYTLRTSGLVSSRYKQTHKRPLERTSEVEAGSWPGDKKAYQNGKCVLSLIQRWVIFCNSGGWGGVGISTSYIIFQN